MEWNQVKHGDNLDIMRELPSESIDLIYCDILYGTGRDFGDYKDLPAKRDVIDAFYRPRLQEMHRLLKETGSIYLQMNSRINHWIRCLMDDVFGYENFMNEIVWIFNSARNFTTKFSYAHEYHAFYTKTGNYQFYPERLRHENPSPSTVRRFGKELAVNGYFIRHGKKNYEMKGGLPLDWVNISFYPAIHTESEEYPTQKPEALLERIIKASSNEGDIVADFFCGSGTTPAVAKRLNRQYFGCDISERAIEITRKRIDKFTAQTTIFEVLPSLN